jgi:4-amino-4-deoxy-L-arabinose transferase-like glycosyltransferase
VLQNLSRIFRKPWLLLLIVIFILGTGLRFFKLGEVPVALNRDEASLGYTAYSILQTGAEEHDQKFPLAIESFGDWKLPGYVYTLIPFIKTFGLNNWSVRLPSAIAGTLSVLLSGVLAWQLTKNKKWMILTALLMAVSPWGIHLSHLAYEANLAMFFFLSGVNLLVWGFNHKNKFGIPCGVFLMGLTLFTYHSYHVFTPLMGLGLLIIFRKQWLELWQKQKFTFGSVVIITLLMVGTLLATSFTANQTKLSGLSIFDTQSYAEQIFINRSLFGDKLQFLSRIYINSGTAIIDQLQRNIFAVYSPRFLFFEGGTHGAHDIAHTGKLYPFEILTLLIALGTLITQIKKNPKNKKFKLPVWTQFILLWITSATVAPIITFEAAHSIRFSPALPGLAMLSAFGLLQIINWLRKQKLIYKFPITVLITLITTYSIVFFTLHYFVVAPTKDLDHHNWQMKRLAQLIKEKENNYDLIIFNNYTWSPYIYLLYEWQYPPQNLTNNLEYLPLDHEGFKHVKRLDNINFGTKNDWLKNEKSGQSILYVSSQDQIPGDKFQNPFYQIEYQLTDPHSQQTWILLSYDKN